MLKAIKVRLYPDSIQANYMNRLLGSCRFVYNNCLAFKMARYETDKTSVGLSELAKHVIELKNSDEYSWLKESHSKVLQQVILNLEVAYKNFFRGGVGFPKFKSRKDITQSCRFPTDAINEITGNRITIIRLLSNLHFKCSHTDEIYLNKHQDAIRSATLTRNKCNQYYFSILIDRNDNKQLPDSANVVGIDLGIKDFVITSQGEVFENLKLHRNNEKQLTKLHRQLSKKVNGSHNKDKARVRLAKLYIKLNNQKEYYLHQVSNSLLRENQTIVMENLNVAGMLKNHKLARSIQELSLFRFKQILKYKAAWYGRDILEIYRWFPSSKLCSNCGYKYTTLTLSERTWKCPTCGEVHDRDLNAALNIEHEGSRLLAIKENKIGLSSAEFTLVNYPTMDDRLCSNAKVLKSSGRLKQEKNVFH